MTMFLVQSAILLAIAFVLGAVIGSLLKHLFGASQADGSNSGSQAPVSAAAEVPQAAEMPSPAMAAPAALAATGNVGQRSASRKDDLKLIVGIGPVNEKKLNALGITRFDEIAAWNAKDEEEFGHKLEFPGRIEREEWVRQAKNLAAGGVSEDEAELARSKRGSSTKNATKAKASSVKPGIAKADAGKVNPAKTTDAKKTAAKSSSTKSPAKTSASKKPMAVKLLKPVGGKPDNLTLINGVGNVIEKKLHDLGVFHFEQIANWTEKMADDFSASIGFPGRARREGWMKEAALFAKGGTTEHARKVEAGEIATSRKSTAAEKPKK